MMTIVYISSEYPPFTVNGGIGTYTKLIAEGMCRRGHTVHVISRSNRSERFEKIINGVTVHLVPPAPFMLPKAPYLYYLRVFLRWLFYHTLVRLSWASSAARELDQLRNRLKKIDIIEYPECGAEGLFISKFPGARTVVRLHTPWYVVRAMNMIREQPGDHVLFKMLEICAIKRADLITAPSIAVVALVLKSKAKSPPFIIPNPVEIPHEQLKKGEKWIYIGRVERRKGVHILLDAYFNVCHKHTPPDLIILGTPFGIDRDGTSYESKIEQKISNSPFFDKVTWIKGVAQSEVHTYVLQSTTAFFPSIWENQAYACLEAMAAGCAVVASDCGGFREMINNGINGILIEPGNAQKWSDAMISLLNNPESIKKLGSAAAVHVNKNYNIDIISMKNEHFFSDHINGYCNG